ncbi:glycosyltransferase family 4 protein [Massilia sp. DWR3-1-1]|uniref:glycosyltransferase family 4 protein n=1 Tax=Massilia sp. DWR3-1-1 TaxID=2804559 RepID=UPI003CE749B9
MHDRPHPLPQPPRPPIAGAAGRPIRILHLLDHSPPHVSRYSWRVMAILRQQRAFGWHTCQLTGPHQPACAPLPPPAGGWQFYRTPAPRAAAAHLAPLALAGTASALAQRLGQVVRLTRPDLLHAHSPLINVVAALWVGRCHGLPVLFEAHAPAACSAAGSIWTGPARPASAGICAGYAMRALEAWLAARAGAVVTNSEAMGQRLRDGGVSARRLTVVPDALDVSRYGAVDARRAHAHGGAALLGVCLGADGDGARLLLAALAMLQRRRPGVGLLIAGAGRHGAEVVQMAARRGLAGQVHLLADDAGAGASAHLQGLADIVVFPQAGAQLAAAPPRSLLEAMARGCVIAAADTSAHRSLIAHGRSGLLFAPDDAGALADALEVLLAARARWPALAEAARWFIEYQRNWEVCVERYRPLYQQLLAPRRPVSAGRGRAVCRPPRRP